MPQMNKGGKFIFGKSSIQASGKVQFPIQAMAEYQITAEGKVYLFTGSKVTGGFCVTRKGLLLPSKLGHILADLPELRDYTAGRRCVSSLQGPLLLLALCDSRRADPSDETDDGFSPHYSRDAAPIHPQQRHCLHHGRQRAASGKGGSL